MLRASALDAVRQWKYRPYLLNGEPTEVETTITVNYNFEGPPASPSPPPVPDAPAPTPEVLLKSVVPPQVLYAPEPEYTELARARHIQGDVVLHLVVDEHGLPASVAVTRGVGYGLDEMAVASVREYRFKPATNQGRAVDYPLDIAVNFAIF